MDYDFIINKMNKEINNIKIINLDGFKENFCNIFILGVPRSGTTLLYQVIVYTTNLCYINNLIARFWGNPCIGIALSKILGIEKNISFESHLGRTPLLSDPHEFGYFWMNSFGLDFNNSKNISVNDFIKKNINWKKLLDKILLIDKCFQNNVVFKNLIAGLFVRELSSILKKSLFIYIKRDFFSNAVSIYNARKSLYNDVSKWWSLKPREYEVLKDKSPEEQVVGQVYYLKREFEKNLNNRVVEINYEDLCINPMEIVEKIVNFAKKTMKTEIKIERTIPPFSMSMQSKNNYPEIYKYIKKYFDKEKSKLNEK